MSNRPASDDITEAPAEDEGAPPRRDFVQSLERGLSVLSVFDIDHPELTLSDVARLTGLDRAATRRFLFTFVGLGYMRQEGRLFSLRPKLLELGFAYLSSLRLPQIAAPHLRVLSAAVHESSYLSIMEDDENVCVAHVPVRRIWTATITVGTRLPLLATASGRVILAMAEDKAIESFIARHPLARITPFTKREPDEIMEQIARIRDCGFAYVDQELELGLRVLAAPVHDGRGRTVAAVSVSTLASGSTEETIMRDMLPPVLRAARDVEIDLEPLTR